MKARTAPMLVVALILFLIIPAFAILDNHQQADKSFYSDLSWSADSSRLIFSMLRGNRSNIYTMKADGTDLKRLTNNDGQYYGACFSPDGQHIAFYSDKAQKDEDIYIMKSDGTEMTRLTRDAGRNVTPGWAPDGSQLVFSSSRGGGLQLYTMNADGTGQKQLTKAGSKLANYYNPVWSPDGKKVVFFAQRDDFRDQIETVDLDGENQKVLTTIEGSNIFPSWSPDSKKILFTNERSSKAIYVMNADGSDVKRLGENSIGFYARWSPNGKQIAFINGKYPSTDIYVMNADGSDLVKVTK